MGLILASTFGLLHDISASRPCVRVTDTTILDAKSNLFARADALIASAFSSKTPALATV